MLAIRSLLRNTTPLSKNVVQKRNMTAIAIPPRNKVGKGEMLFLSAAMVVSWCAIPAWVLINIKHYRAHE